MIIIQTKNQITNYVVGIFTDPIEATDYLQNLDDDKFEMSVINLNYTFIIIERLVNNINKFDFYQTQAEIKLQDNEITEYFVYENFKPEEIGEDEMGKLHHVHIERDVE